MKYKLKCPACDSDLELSVGFTGCDWDTKAGEGSGYDYPLSLDCTNNNCARVYPLVHLKNENCFSEVLDKYKCVK